MFWTDVTFTTNVSTTLIADEMMRDEDFYIKMLRAREVIIIFGFEVFEVEIRLSKIYALSKQKHIAYNLYILTI